MGRKETKDKGRKEGKEDSRRDGSKQGRKERTIGQSTKIVTHKTMGNSKFSQYNFKSKWPQLTEEKPQVNQQC